MCSEFSRLISSYNGLFDGETVDSLGMWTCEVVLLNFLILTKNIPAIRRPTTIPQTKVPTTELKNTEKIIQFCFVESEVKVEHFMTTEVDVLVS